MRLMSRRGRGERSVVRKEPTGDATGAARGQSQHLQLLVLFELQLLALKQLSRLLFSDLLGEVRCELLARSGSARCLRRWHAGGQV